MEGVLTPAFMVLAGTPRHCWPCFPMPCLPLRGVHTTQALSFARCFLQMGSVDDNGSGGSYAYRASKAALNIINKSLSIDLAGDGVTCVLLHPGMAAAAVHVMPCFARAAMQTTSCLVAAPSGAGLQGTIPICATGSSDMFHHWPPSPPQTPHPPTAGWVRTDMTDWEGLIDTQECVEGLLRVLEGSKPLNGRWYDYKGTEIPW